MGAVKTFLTFEEFERTEYSPFKQELIHGELRELPPPELEHHKISHRVFKRMDAAVEHAQASGVAIQVGVTYHEVGYKFPDNTWLNPDARFTHAGQA